jgi:hypothetical protein
MDILLFIFAVLGLLYFFYRRDMKKKRNDYSLSFESSESLAQDPFHKENAKPSENEIESLSGEEKYSFYTTIRDEITNIGTPALLWRGEMTGWVLTVLESSGRIGSVKFVDDHLVGQAYLTPTILGGIVTDPRCPASMNDSWPVLGMGASGLLSQGGHGIEIRITNMDTAKDFATFMGLAAYYS